MKRFGWTVGPRLLALAAMTAASLLLGVSSGHAATPSTVFDAIGVDSPDPGQTSGRWPERLIDSIRYD